jgi:hypothetical protein
VGENDTSNPLLIEYQRCVLFLEMSITIDGFDNEDSAIAGYSAYMEVGGGGYYATLANIDIEGEKLNFVAVSGVAVQLDADFVPTVIAVNGVNFAPAGNPQEPIQGEYVYNPYNQTITIYGSGNAVIIGNRETIPIYPPLSTAPHPWILTRLPLEGAISINRNFEQHPSAQFEFESVIGKSFLENALRPGYEVDIYGIPLRINSVLIKEFPRTIYPDGRVKVSLSFGGRWENYIEESCFLKSNGKNLSGEDTPFQDSDCQISTTLSSTTKDSTSVVALLAKINIPYIGVALEPVNVPKDTANDTLVNPSQLLQERARIAYGFEFWSDASGVGVKRIGEVQTWSYDEANILSEIDTSYDAINRSNKAKLIQVEGFIPDEPNLVNFPANTSPYPVPALRVETVTALGYEYKNAELSGEFSQPKEKSAEKTQGESIPRYVKKQPKRTERIEGDVNAHVPLEGVQTVRVMSLCFDIGGQTKTRTTVTEENGTRVQEVNEIWGFAYTAGGIYDDSTKSLRGTTEETWKCLKKTTTQYIYDANTGYLLYINESGYNTVRYQQESADKPETLTLVDSDKLSLYDFIQIPVTSRASYYLKLMPDWDSEGRFEFVKVCNRDGTSEIVAVRNPDFAPPYYAKVERNESVAFASRPNPANTGLAIESGKKRQPDLTAGEESRFEAKLDITPAEYAEIYTGETVGNFPVVRRGEELQPQKNNKYIRKFKAQGQAIAEALEDVSVEESTGNPPTSQRRADLYTREENQANTSAQTSNDATTRQYRYFMQTSGYTYQDPINGSESFAVAPTLEKALIAAQAKLAIENWRQGHTESLQIPGNLRIKEGDRFNYFCNGEYRQRVVLSVQHNIQILGVVDNIPQITCVTSLQLGRYILPTFTWNKVKVPQPSKNSSNDSIIVYDVINETLGNTIDWTLTRSRRNP